MFPQDLKNYTAPRFTGEHAVALACAFAVLSGCASYPADLQTHEERHCDGWEHTGDAPFYTWTQVRPASVKPWLYVRVNNVERACGEYGIVQEAGQSINGCAQWKPVNCIIILPK